MHLCTCLERMPLRHRDSCGCAFDFFAVGLAGAGIVLAFHALLSVGRVLFLFIIHIIP